MKPRELEEPIPIDLATAYMEKTGPGADAHDLLKRLDIGPELELNKGEVGGGHFNRPRKCKKGPAERSTMFGCYTTRCGYSRHN